MFFLSFFFLAVIRSIVMTMISQLRVAQEFQSIFFARKFITLPHA